MHLGGNRGLVPRFGLYFSHVCLFSALLFSGVESYVSKVTFLIFFLWVVVGRCGSLWIVVDRCGSLWIVVGRCGSFRVLVTTVRRHVNYIKLEQNIPATNRRD